jgi:hypothetical protein
MPSHYGKMGHKNDPNKKKKKPNAKNGRMAAMKKTGRTKKG